MLKIELNQTQTTLEVSNAYGITKVAVQKHFLNNSDEFIEGIHYFYAYEQTNGGKQRLIKWTLEGVYMLGFFIKSKQAKVYRKQVAELLTKLKAYHEAQIKNQLESSNKEVIRLIDKLATTEAILIRERKHHNCVVNGYKSQIAQHSKALEEERLKISFRLSSMSQWIQQDTLGKISVKIDQFKKELIEIGATNMNEIIDNFKYEVENNGFKNIRVDVKEVKRINQKRRRIKCKI